MKPDVLDDIMLCSMCIERAAVSHMWFTQEHCIGEVETEAESKRHNRAVLCLGFRPSFSSYPLIPPHIRKSSPNSLFIFCSQAGRAGAHPVSSESHAPGL